jgi:hypothetical protein
MAGGEEALGEEGADGVAEVEEPHGIGDGGAVAADAFGDVFLAEPEFLCEAGVGFGFFDGVEVFALEVLDESHFEDIAVAGESFDDGDIGESELLAGAEAAFACDEFEGAVDGADDEWLDDAVFADGFHQFRELFSPEVFPGLHGGWGDGGEGDLADGGAGFCGFGLLGSCVCGGQRICGGGSR